MRERLQKILSAAGVTSRRRAEDLLRAGRVRVNGVVAGLGDSADPERDRIALDGEAVRAEPAAFWVMNKPRGVLTTARDPHGRRTVIDLLPRRAPRVYPVGRLDRDTEGLLLLTNRGDVTQVLLHPSHGSEREYRVTARGRIGAEDLRRLERGLPLRDGRTAPARVARVRHDPAADVTTFDLTIGEGRKRQIRRSLSFLGHPVVRLVRIRMGPLRLGRLETGEVRPLDPRERRRLLDHVEALRR